MAAFSVVLSCIQKQIKDARTGRSIATHITFLEQNQRVKEPVPEALKEEKVRPELQLFKY